MRHYLLIQLSLSLISLLLLSFCNRAPIADFELLEDYGVVGRPIRLTNKSMGKITEYEWGTNYGITFGINPTLVADCEGIMEIHLNVTGPGGIDYAPTKSINIYAFDPLCKNYGVRNAMSNENIGKIKVVGIKQAYIEFQHDVSIDGLVGLYEPKRWLDCTYNPVYKFNLIGGQKGILSSGSPIVFSDDWGINVTLKNGDVSCIRTIASMGDYLIRNGNPYYIIKTSRVINGL